MAASSSAPAAASSGLTREASIYSWTIDELHSAVINNNNDININHNNNRGVGSLNMDELLRNICSAEETYAGGGDPDPAIVSTNGPLTNLARQGSLTLPRSIVNKTVEEVWKEIQTTATASASASATATANGGAEGETSTGKAASAPVQRELTLGEMTLEDFLAKAGVVREDTLPGVNTGPQNLSQNPHEDWLNFQFKAAQAPQALAIQHPQQQNQHQHQQIHRQFQQPLFGKSQAAPGVPVLQSSSTGSILEPSMESGATSSFVPVAFGNGVHRLSPASASARGKKRVLDAPEDKAVEQRQRRMIKNRESAARSRERKQAYTVELEAQVTQLKEENAELSRLEEVAKKKRFKQLMETLIPVEEMQKPPRVLRRTRTVHW